MDDCAAVRRRDREVKDREAEVDAGVQPEGLQRAPVAGDRRTPDGDCTDTFFPLEIAAVMRPDAVRFVEELQHGRVNNEAAAPGRVAAVVFFRRYRLGVERAD